MKIRLTLTVASLLFAAMLLVNLVLLAFWKHDAIQRQTASDYAVLAHVQRRRALESYPNLSGFAEFCPAAMSESSSRKLRQDRVTSAAGVTRSLEPVLQTLWQAEKIVLIYMAVNLLVLTTIFFFRLNSLIVRPIERLAELAGQHSSHEAVWFAAEDSGGEFNRLAGSLNLMLAKIEDDRKILQKTVAELKTANQQLHERQEEMIRAEKLASVGRMAAGLAHEIGNPLAVVQGCLDLLSRSGQSAENRDFISRTDQELQRVNRLVRQLLDCARISKGRPDTVSLHERLHSMAEMIRVQAAFKRIKLMVKTEAAQDMVHADPDQLHQVLLNCLLNSADA
ncbi:hypothetical protein VU06_00175, partial [Desulfobulbus sp. F3]|nr:hypothetical protein [Desulfobulbus sp. F3]